MNNIQNTVALLIKWSVSIYKWPKPIKGQIVDQLKFYMTMTNLADICVYLGWSSGTTQK